MATQEIKSSPTIGDHDATLQQKRLRRLYELSTDVSGDTGSRIRETLKTGLEMFDLDIATPIPCCMYSLPASI